MVIQLISAIFTDLLVCPKAPLHLQSAVASPLVAPQTNINSTTTSGTARHRGLQQYHHRQRQQQQQQQHYQQRHQQQRQQENALSQTRSRGVAAELEIKTHHSHHGHHSSTTTSPTHHSPSITPRNIDAVKKQIMPHQTPLTAARASVGRLNRLSTDLHNLAEKLDKFENTSTKNNSIKM